LNTKAGIQTPVLGRTANLDAAVALALHDPEEPDANAMFEAVSLYDRLLKEQQPNEVFEIASICGSELGGVSADRKIVAELNHLTEVFNANEIILVTDGYTDEAVLPLIESRVPVSSVRRIVVKHSESIEETAALFSRYLKLMVENPKYSRIALGIPGILFFIWGLLSLFPTYVVYYLTAIVLIFGGFLLIKGFGVDSSVRDFYKWIREYSPPPLPAQIANYATIAGVLCVVVSVYSGYTSALDKLVSVPVDTAGWISVTPMLAGNFLKGALDLVIVGICAALVGRSIRWYFERDARVLRNLALIVSVAWSRMILSGAIDVLISPSRGYTNLVVFIVVGILIAIASGLMILIIHQSAASFFTKSESKVDELGKDV
jgi:putative membrane protein